MDRLSVLLSELRSTASRRLVYGAFLVAGGGRAFLLHLACPAGVFGNSASPRVRSGASADDRVLARGRISSEARRKADSRPGFHHANRYPPGRFAMGLLRGAVFSRAARPPG